MSPGDLKSEYDAKGDFYFERTKRDRSSDTDVLSFLSLLGDVSGKDILDLGCGDGFLSRMLHERGAVVTGVDISTNLLGHARRLSEGLPITFLLEDAQGLPSLPDASFDAVVCCMALMDIHDLPSAARAISRVLRDDGEFLFAMLHPCFETPFNATNPPEETDAKGNFVAKRVNGYNVEGKWYSDGAGIRGTLGSIHRKLSTYVNELSAAGLLIKEMFEPMIPPGDYDDFAQQYQSNVPTFLEARCVKHRR